MLTDDEELDPLVFDNLEVNSRTEVAHVDPTSSPLYRILRPDYDGDDDGNGGDDDDRQGAEHSHLIAYLSILLFSQER